MDLDSDGILCYNHFKWKDGNECEMQLIITMRRPEKFRVPFNYNHQLQSAIYAKLREAGYSDFLHDGGYSSSHRYKAFVFG